MTCLWTSCVSPHRNHKCHRGGVFFTGQETYGTAVVVAASINFTRGVVFHGEKTYGTPMLASASRPLCPLAQISRGEFFTEEQTYVTLLVVGPRWPLRGVFDRKLRNLYIPNLYSTLHRGDDCGPPSQRAAIAKVRHSKGPPSQRAAIAKVSDKNYDDCRIFKKASFLSFHGLTDHRATCIRANSDEEL